MSSLLTLRQARRTFDEDAPEPVHALDGVDLEVDAGDLIAITGRSGSGKTTLLNVIGLLETLTGGDYLVHGERVLDMSGRALDDLRAKMFGFVFQAFHLVPYLTTLENIELGMTYRDPGRVERRRRAQDLVDRVGLGNRQSAPVATLSGGERQRVAIARALVRQPEIILADEPTGNLDEENAYAILDLFDDINREGVTVLIVTHDMLTANRTRRRVHIRDGKIATEPPGEL